MSSLELAEARQIAEKWRATGRISIRPPEPDRRKEPTEYSKTSSAVCNRRRRARWVAMGLTTEGKPRQRAQNKPKV